MTLLDGDLQHRIRFERKTDARDPLGGPGKPVWVEVVSVWAKTTNNLAATTEAVAAGAERYREQVRFDIRPVMLILSGGSCSVAAPSISKASHPATTVARSRSLP